MPVRAAPSAHTRPPLPSSSVSVQRKLAVGSANDPLEHEADNLAERIMRMPDPGTPVSTTNPTARRLQRTCAECKSRDEQENDPDERHVRRKISTAGPSIAGEAPASVDAVIRERGRPLDPTVRAFFEPRFGADFSSVRIHSDERAAKSATAVDALGYTVGNHIVFAAGQYQPSRDSGRRLLAHELTHVLQQSAIVRRDAAGQQTVKPKGFTVVRTKGGALRIADVWKSGDNLRSFENRIEVLYLHWRFGAIPIDVEARLLGILADALATPFPQGEFTPAPGGYYCIEIGTDIEARMVTLVEQARSAPRSPPASTPAEDQPPVVSEKHTRTGESTPPSQADKASASDRAPSASAGTGEPSTAVVASLDFLKKVDPAFSNGYLAMMENFAGLRITPQMRTLAQSRLGEKDIATIMGSDPLRVDLTRRYLQAVIEYTAWTGRDYSRFSRMVETLLEQYSRGNPTAINNNLAIGRGRRDNAWGIFHRPDWWMYYDEFGQALRSVAGGAFMDPGYVGAEKAPVGIDISGIQDPAIRGLLNMLRQSVGEPTRMVFQAAHHLLENIDLVKAEVLNNLSTEIKQKFSDMLPLFIGFLGGKAVSIFLERSPTPQTAAIGLALHGLIEAAGYLMQIDFAAHMTENILNAGYHISRLRQKDDGTLTEVSQHHLVEGGAYLRQIASDLALLAGTKAFSALLGAIGKIRRVQIECTVCKISFEGEPQETGAQMERRMLKADEATKGSETPERFSLREPIKAGERRNTLNRIVAVLRSRADSLVKEGKARELAAKINSPEATKILEGSALDFVLKDAQLAREWLRLSLIKAAVENPSIRKSREFKALPKEYIDLLARAPRAVRQIVEEIAAFEKGSVGNKRIDIIDLKLDQNEATVTDVTQASTPWHLFKTRFYARVIKALTGFRVDAMDIGGHPMETPEPMLDEPE